MKCQVIMKSKIKITGILLVFILLPAIFPKQALAQEPYISYQVFYDQLSPYGQWVDFPRYGYVWLPNAGPDFFPYSSRGSWIMTDYGWTWLSDYSWGWAPFHYGRWDYDNFYGWYWVPDNVWGPAWVTWRKAPGYYGWAPMGPGMSIGMSFGNNYNNYNNHWNFVKERYFGRNNINRYYASQNDYDMLFRNSSVINNTYVDNSSHTTYVSGPTKSDVREVTGRRVNTYTIQGNNVPGQSLSNGELRIYRPQVMQNNDNERRSAPSVITDLNDVRRASEINSTSTQENINTYGNRRQEQRQDSIDRQNTVDQQNVVDQRNAANQENAVQRQNEVDQQNAVNRRNAVNRQNTLNQQNAADQQNAANRQNTVNQQNAADQQNAVNRQNTVNQQNAAEQQDAVNRQKSVNRQNATDNQDAVKRQNDVNQQNKRNNERVLRQQNAVKLNNGRREQSVNTVNNPKNSSSEESRKKPPQRNN